MKRLSCMLAAVFLVAALSVPAHGDTKPELPVRPYLPLELAETALRTCRMLAQERGWNVAIAVRDASGTLLAVARMDNARAMPVEVAIQKAGTAAMTGRATIDLRRIALIDSDPPHGIERLPGIVVIEGGEPIFSRGRSLLGGIGVSGATPEQDGECARMAIQSISDRL